MLFEFEFVTVIFALLIDDLHGIADLHLHFLFRGAIAMPDNRDDTSQLHPEHVKVIRNCIYVCERASVRACVFTSKILYS